MTDFALSTNLYGLAAIQKGFIEWPSTSGEAEVLRQMRPGDLVVPKFAQDPDFAVGDSLAEDQAAYCEGIGIDPDRIATDYNELVRGGQNAVPMILRVVGRDEIADHPTGKPWTRVQIEIEELPHPLSTYEFLRLRVIPIQLAGQFKAIAAPGRHIQELPDATVAAIRQAGQTADRGDLLREYSLVEAGTPEAAVEELRKSNRRLLAGDRAFVASHAGMLGVFEVARFGGLEPIGTPIAKTPIELLELFEAAKARMLDSDPFAPNPGIAAAKEIAALLEGPLTVLAIDNFSQFHDRYVLLARRVNQALEIETRPLRPTPEGERPLPEPHDPEEETVELDEIAALSGLDIQSVRNALPDGMVLPDSVLAEAVTALRAGKHLLLSGPPGTGKTTLARALAEAVVGQQYDVATATADWTTFDTIGGYMPASEGKLIFEPGMVLRCLQRGWWLVIDELNRADIDKAFGPMFTLLAGDAKPAGRGIALPFQEDGRSIEIIRAERRAGAKSRFVLTPGWRLIGTLNIADKASLFQLSFAFLRRFAVIDVPLPPEADYRLWFDDKCKEIKAPERGQIVEAAMTLAFGPIEIGPAILADIAHFVSVALVETSTGQPMYPSAIEAFLTAVRLYVVPQYEGATPAETNAALSLLRAIWPNDDQDGWGSLEQAMNFVAVS